MIKYSIFPSSTVTFTSSSTTGTSTTPANEQHCYSIVVAPKKQHLDSNTGCTVKLSITFFFLFALSRV